MKKRVSLFIAIVLVALAIAPIVNVLSAGSHLRVPRAGQEPLRWWDRAFLYNLDFASSWLSRALYPLGVSTDPNQVIIGRGGWLYLGDKYASTRSVARRGQTADDVALAQRIGVAARAWESWLRRKGVRLYCVMVGPNKGTIYPEQLPHWASPARPSATDALIDGVGHDLYVDLRQVLTGSKKLYPQALYYQTDTHWNSLGAALAFRAFAEHVNKLDPGLRWPPGQGAQVLRVARRAGGDLALFLRLLDELPDSNPVVQPFIEGPVKVAQQAFAPGGAATPGGSQAGAAAVAVRVTSDRALNAKRVLWLQDSFGLALAPFMAATFTETVQLHWSHALADGGRRFVELVESWQPDYVFVTVVERDARSELFAGLPPSISDPSGFATRRGSSLKAVHDLVAGSVYGEWRIKGNDPFLDYSLSAPISVREAPLLAFDLMCEKPTAPVALQVFLLKAGDPYFTESNSTRLSTKPGTIVIDLTSIPVWMSGDEIARVRIDINSPQTCSAFKMSEVELGAHTVSGDD